MTNEEIEAFLIRLAQDDAFRAQVQADPAGALAPYGIVVDPALAPPNASVTLPPGQRILDELANLQSDFSALLCQVPLHHPFWQGNL